MLRPYDRAQLCFQLQTEIGHEGQNSEVFIAHDPQLDAEIVMKKIPKASFSCTAEYYEESSILHKSSHPNVVPIHYACEDTNSVYLAMPYYAKGSINQLINSKFLTVREIIKLSSQFLSGLHNIHSKRLIHFDIKPDNILVSDQGEALVSDFGLSRPLGPNGLAGQDRMYLKMLPPEAFNGNEFSNKFDIYQAGLTIYRMCVGNTEFYRQFNQYGDQDNFDRDSFKFDVRMGRFPVRENFPEHLPQALISTMKKCLEPEPSQRYDAVIHIINNLADIQDEILDWQYSEGDQGRVWEKTEDQRTVRLQVNADGSSVATKQTASGNLQNIRNYCLQSINRAKIKEFLRNH